MQIILTDFDEILTKGGAARVALLQFCVRSITIEPLFAFLVREYRIRPTHASALALYDMFCAPAAPARLAATHVLPLRDLRFSATLDAIRSQWRQIQLTMASAELDESSEILAPMPPRSLFDDLVDALQNDRKSSFLIAALQYDPERSVSENLPEGAMNASQRHFLESVWLPLVRPRLVEAGFWRLSSIA